MSAKLAGRNNSCITSSHWKLENSVRRLLPHTNCAIPRMFPLGVRSEFQLTLNLQTGRD